MSVNIAHYSQKLFENDQWEWVELAFPVDNVIRLERGQDISHLENVVLMMPVCSNAFTPTINLKDYVHPDDVTYLFGSDHFIMNEEDLPFKDCDVVYVEADREMWSFQAGLITLYDRRIKRG